MRWEFRSLPLSWALDEEETFLASLGEVLLPFGKRTRMIAVQAWLAVCAPLTSLWVGKHAYY